MSNTRLPRTRQHIRAIDGLRALAVTAVLLYHLGIGVVNGGFLGVDLFFVISGYVITRLLVSEHHTQGRIDFEAFYLARIRRLVPALVLLIFILAVTFPVLAPTTLERFTADLPFALTGTLNWSLVEQGNNYFLAMGRPSILQHTWSLAVEAQYYLLWPLVIAVVWRRFGRASVPKAAITLAAFSACAMAIVTHDLANSTTAASHQYFGTDTRAFGLLAGSALAVYWAPENLRGLVTAPARWTLDGVAVFALTGVLALITGIGEWQPGTATMAYFQLALFATALIAVLVHPASRVARLFETKPLLWLGERSYGIYLWHWPLFVITRPGIDTAATGWFVHVLRVAAVLVLAEVSYRYVEVPFRRGLLGRWLANTRAAGTRRRAWRVATVSTLAITALSTATVVSATALRTQNPALSSPTRQTLALPSAAAASPAATTPAALPAEVGATSYRVFGDSVMLALQPELVQALPITHFDAVVGRQLPQTIAAVRAALPTAGDEGIIVNLGNNGHLDRDDVRALLRLIAKQPRVVVINCFVPQPWQDLNNRKLAEITGAFPNVELVDWHGIATGHPEYFVDDGVHPSAVGAKAFAAAIIAAAR